MHQAVYFPNGFDWGYADINVITSKKFYNIGHWWGIAVLQGQS